MKVKLNEPSWIDPNGPQYVMFLQVPGFTYWKESWKEVPYTEFGNIPLTDLPIELYVEIPHITELRGLTLSLEYPVSLGMSGPTGVFDIVKATGIWSYITADFATRDYSDIFHVGPGGGQGPPTPFDDMETSPKQLISAIGGLGVRPVDPNEGVRYGIAFQFHILPERDILTQGSWESDDVRFDTTRKIECRNWGYDGTGWDEFDCLIIGHGPNGELAEPVWPIEEEKGNDQLNGPNINNEPEEDQWTGGESTRVTGWPHVSPGEPDSPNNFYSVDTPGLREAVGILPGARMYYNFTEFMRVKFDGVRPKGPLSGSRVSPFYDWHVKVHLVSGAQPGQPAPWQHAATDNEIGPGHIDINVDPNS